MHKIVVIESEKQYEVGLDDSAAIDAGWQLEANTSDEDERIYTCSKDNRLRLRISGNRVKSLWVNGPGARSWLHVGCTQEALSANSIPQCDDVIAADITSAVQTFRNLERPLGRLFDENSAAFLESVNDNWLIRANLEGVDPNAEEYEYPDVPEIANILLFYNIDTKRFEMACLSDVGERQFPLSATKALVAYIVDEIEQY